MGSDEAMSDQSSNTWATINMNHIEKPALVLDILEFVVCLLGSLSVDHGCFDDVSCSVEWLTMKDNVVPNPNQDPWDDKEERSLSLSPF